MAEGETIIETTSDAPVRLDLACGATPRPGFRGVDLYADGCERVDLLQFPWPWADGSVDEVACSHFIEHIPMCYVDEAGAFHLVGGAGRVDLFLRFFDELYRVLKLGARVEILVPYLHSHRAYQDPTHRRFICEETFLYLNRDWRAANGLEHYLGASCHFAFAPGSPTRIVDQEESLRHPEAVQRRMRELWGVVSDLKVELIRC